MTSLVTIIDSLGSTIVHFLRQGIIGDFSFVYFLVWNVLFHPVLVTLGLILIWYRAHVIHKDRVFAGYALAFAFGAALVTWIKTVTERERPISILFGDQQFLYAIAGSSFPSAHALLATIAIGLLSLYLYNSKRSRFAKNTTIIIGSIAIISIGFSRVYFGAHWLSDVIVGWVLGCCIVYFSYLFFLSSKKQKHRLHRVAENHAQP
jgi:membrane-associated phospholipid phosphatase